MCKLRRPLAKLDCLVLKMVLELKVKEIKNRVGYIEKACEELKKSEKFKQIIEANASKAAPTWLDVNKDNQTAKVLRMPVKEDLDYDIEEHLIVELYSK